MSLLVVDGSTAISFLLKDEVSPVALRSLEAMRVASSVFVPSHFWIELTNALLMAERRHRASRADISEALQMALSLPVITDEQTVQQCTGSTLALAREHALTIYDAAYLELALRRRSVLATVEKALVRAAKATGVALLT